MAARAESMRKCAARIVGARRQRRVRDALAGERHLDRLRIVGDQLEPDVAVLARPAFGDAADEQRLPSGEPAHPAERLDALATQRDRVGVAAEQRVVIGERSFDFVVGREPRRFRQHQLPRGLALARASNR